MDRVLETTGLKSGSKWYHVNDGFYFKVSDSDANRVYLKCVEKNCPCRATMPLTTEQRTTELFIRRAPHNHAPDNNWSRVAALRQRILQRCKEEVTDCRIIFEAECTRTVDGIGLLHHVAHVIVPLSQM
ncbi:hypothetical protein J6590_101684 [Homalodisca vitripennis]|nr:hypothetical protein J6590_089728 [Homalodisca vitripennis]KAG8269706.1 hypothetical protein J6590_101684 [Homalodisca vitripennis]